MGQIDSLLIEIEKIKNELQEIKKAEELTFAEREIYRCMLKNMSRREIAETLYKSESTVKKQIKSIKTKLQ